MNDIADIIALKKQQNGPAYTFVSSIIAAQMFVQHKDLEVKEKR